MSMSTRQVFGSDMQKGKFRYRVALFPKKQNQNGKMPVFSRNKKMIFSFVSGGKYEW